MFSISSSNCCWVRFSVPYEPVSWLQRASAWGHGRMSSHLEGKMLEEVCGAVGLGGFCPGTGIDPDADGRGLRVGRVLGRNL